MGEGRRDLNQFAIASSKILVDEIFQGLQRMKAVAIVGSGHPDGGHVSHPEDAPTGAGAAAMKRKKPK